jgi:hypothetical protein
MVFETVFSVFPPRFRVFGGTVTLLTVAALPLVYKRENEALSGPIIICVHVLHYRLPHFSNCLHTQVKFKGEWVQTTSLLKNLKSLRHKVTKEKRSDTRRDRRKCRFVS